MSQVNVKNDIRFVCIIIINNMIITLEYKGKLYSIEREPFETTEDSYKRAWYIVQNYDNFAYDQLYSMSIMKMNEKKGMHY